LLLCVLLYIPSLMPVRDGWALSALKPASEVGE
jgi:hypothetical protein